MVTEYSLIYVVIITYVYVFFTKNTLKNGVEFFLSFFLFVKP